jgi:hypothetical protein
MQLDQVNQLRNFLIDMPGLKDFNFLSKIRQKNDINIFSEEKLKN